MDFVWFQFTIRYCALGVLIPELVKVYKASLSNIEIDCGSFLFLLVWKRRLLQIHYVRLLFIFIEKLKVFEILCRRLCRLQLGNITELLKRNRMLILHMLFHIVLALTINLGQLVPNLDIINFNIEVNFFLDASFLIGDLHRNILYLLRMDIEDDLPRTIVLIVIIRVYLLFEVVFSIAEFSRDAFRFLVCRMD